ncbi:Alpha/Beta hydrolase protein [Mycena epipterygia]|nr:Alpha/Beta hydrolase protein [Mycena epipterygia]
MARSAFPFYHYHDHRACARNPRDRRQRAPTSTTKLSALRPETPSRRSDVATPRVGEPSSNLRLLLVLGFSVLRADEFGTDSYALTPPLPAQQWGSHESTRGACSKLTHTRWLVGCTLALAWVLYSWHNWSPSRSKTETFYANVTSPTNICPATRGPGISHSGYIGLRGDSETAPKRTFFWYFEAEHDSETAPIIMTMGGGPGASGMLNPMSEEGPCLAGKNGTVPNPNRWTEHFNVIALDHPVGVGFSYGTKVNNSRSAAIDAYDFLQKFFRLFPHLSQ